MAIYSVRVLPPNSNKLTSEHIDRSLSAMSGRATSTPLVTFERDAQSPRQGFDPSSVERTEYGFKANYLLEEEITIPTISGEKKEFRVQRFEGKFIKKEGVLLIASALPKRVDDVCKKWIDVMFPEKIVSCEGLKLSQDQLHNIIKNHAKTVIQVSHIKCKGLDKIRIHAYDLTNKKWYRDEQFESDQVEQITFIPILSGSLEKKTAICRIYYDGKFVIYHNAKFSEQEFTQIELHIVDVLAEIFGSPLCHLGSRSSQNRLMTY